MDWPKAAIHFAIKRAGARRISAPDVAGATVEARWSGNGALRRRNHQLVCSPARQAGGQVVVIVEAPLPTLIGHSSGPVNWPPQLQLQLKQACLSQEDER